MKRKIKLKNKYKNIIFIIIFLFYSGFSLEVLCSEKWWFVYFTHSGKKEVLSQNPEDAFIRLLRRARKSFYGAFYEITSQPIIKEIIDADRRGIDVKLVLERDNLKKRAERQLLKAGIKIITDNRKALMHNKFAIIDNKVVWTGSYNLTFNCGYKNNNNAIEIHSEDVAGMYLEEFREMFNYKIFGNKKEYTVFSKFRKTYYAKIGETDINVYFSPDDNVERIILERIKKAKQSIHFMAYSYTSDRISEEMIRRYKNGIKVYGIIEKIGSNSKDSEFVKLKLEGLPVKLDKNKNRMHHKVIIIDDKTLISGSYNLSKSANEKNDENIIILNNSDIADIYIKEFLKLYK